MQNSKPLVWVLADDKPGHHNQARGVAQALGFPFEMKSLEYTKLAGLPNALKGASLLGIADQPKAEISPPWPDVVIAAGRRTAPVARYIKRKSGGKAFTVQLMWPGNPVRGLDLIAVPAHDGIAPSEKVITTLGAPHHLTQEFLLQSAASWERKFAEYRQPRIAVLLGGNSGKFEFTATHGAKLAYLASRLVGEAGGSMLVTASRRTPPEAAARFRKSIACPYYWYDPSQGLPNPYMAILGSADVIVVTGDSVSMCSEACFTGKPVFIYAPDGLVPEKHQKFLNALFAEGYASPLVESALPPVGWRSQPGRVLDAASLVAEEIRKRLALV